MAEAEPKMVSIMLFSKHCGDVVRLSADRKKAGKIWLDGRLSRAPVYSECPMLIGRLYQVCVEEVCNDYMQTSFGVVTQHPETYPTYNLNVFHSSVVCIDSDDVWCLGRIKEKRRDYLRGIPQHSRVGLALDRERTLHLFLDGQNMGVIAHKIPSPCYFMYDLSHRVRQIAALPITIIDPLNQEPKQKTSWSENRPSH